MMRWCLHRSHQSGTCVYGGGVGLRMIKAPSTHTHSPPMRPWGVWGIETSLRLRWTTKPKETFWKEPRVCLPLWRSVRPWHQDAAACEGVVVTVQNTSALLEKVFSETVSVSKTASVSSWSSTVFGSPPHPVQVLASFLPVILSLVICRRELSSSH